MGSRSIVQRFRAKFAAISLLLSDEDPANLDAAASEQLQSLKSLFCAGLNLQLREKEEIEAIIVSNKIVPGTHRAALLKFVQSKLKTRRSQQTWGTAMLDMFIAPA